MMDSDEPLSHMIDVSFAVGGPCVPRAHRRALSAALLQALPSLGDMPGFAVHPLKLSSAGEQTPLLSRRTRLTLRVPRERSAEVNQLVGRTLQVGDDCLTLGSAQARELVAHSTVFSHLVDNGEHDELAFLAAVDAALKSLDVKGRAICGRHQALDGEQLQGYSLMVDGLTPAAALRVMESGLGQHHRLGCGVFVPHRSAVAVGT